MTQSFQPTILRFDSIDSTNLEALRHARAGAPEGLCVVAREQTAGRGRLDRKWHSARDAGVYFSIILRPRMALNSWPLLTFMAGLAVVDAVFRSCGIRADIKWPNDVYLGDKKVCGILSETIDTQIGPAAIVGIGINVTPESVPGEISATATSLEDVTRMRVDQELLVDQLVRAIPERYDALNSEDGLEHTIREWCANSSYAMDRSVRVSLGSEAFSGITRGVESDGALRIEAENGRIRIVRAGDVTALRSSQFNS
jgi:BirA family biotin operon repressor/biotin-[acetyl-CoA-carboxylase] ligase